MGTPQGPEHPFGAQLPKRGAGPQLLWGDMEKGLAGTERSPQVEARTSGAKSGAEHMNVYMLGVGEW